MHLNHTSLHTLRLTKLIPRIKHRSEILTPRLQNQRIHSQHLPLIQMKYHIREEVQIPALAHLNHDMAVQLVDFVFR